MNPIKDPEKLLQEMDINRLRAVVYRDVVSHVICTDIIPIRTKFSFEFLVHLFVLM